MTATWRNRVILAAPVLALGVLLAVSPTSEGPTICPFALCTGTACPGCGMTRAASALLRGDFDVAMALHPLMPLIALQLAGGWVWYLLRRSGRVQAMSTRTLNAVLIVTGLALLAVWVSRLVGGTLPPV